MRFILTGGQRHDGTQALDLLSDINGNVLLADKSYNVNSVIQAAQNRGITVAISPKKNRLIQRDYDKDLYKERNLIERLFNKLKLFRRVATRYDKTAAAFRGFIPLAAIIIWLK